MIRLEHARLGAGLSALAVPEDGSVTITVSSSLDHGDQRAAVRTAMRAARRAGWLPSRLPGWLLLPLAGLSRAARVKAVIAAASVVAVSAVAATVLVAAPPSPSGSVRVVPGGVAASGSAVVHRHRRRPVRVRTVRTVARPGRTAPAVTAPAVAAGQPSPQVQVSAPLPTVSATVSASLSVPPPAPSSSPPVKAGTCVYLLGIKVCLGL